MFSFHDEQLNQETYTSRYVCLSSQRKSFLARFDETLCKVYIEGAQNSKPIKTRVSLRELGWCAADRWFAYYRPEAEMFLHFA